MARSVWSGVITFGLATVPVQLFTATETHTIHFHQLQRGTSDRVRNRRVNERTGEEVPFDEIVKGFDTGEGEYVFVDPEELDDIAPGRSRAIDISGFVDLDSIDPVYFDRTYYLGPKAMSTQRSTRCCARRWRASARPASRPSSCEATSTWSHSRPKEESSPCTHCTGPTKSGTPAMRSAHYRARPRPPPAS
ncbi:Ku protein [Streptomyces sp. Tue6028]|uniref:non-homologous end joining protein Ku n=1 Tax=Streptomyces sp. Tue6028 TaxID=2036037 RepID=UPI003D7597FE